MKIQFNPNLDYQAEAVNSIVDIFEGQETCRTNFSVAPLKMERDWFKSAGQNGLGVGNQLKLTDQDILNNVRKIQLRNGLAPSEALDGMNFTVEMETGTGKTYVYLRTIFELNRKYGFTKFIIVVPSIAIKEGVNKSLQMTEDHFRGLYDNAQCEYFVYDSQKLGQVRSFATNDYIQIMIINIDAFRKSFTDPEREDKANIIHRPHDRMTGSRPIEFVQSTNPIVIIDEPQSVDTTAKSREAIASLNPLCTLRFSATHVDKYNMVYRLDSVDAYERKLVKQIEVAGTEVQDSHNTAYIKLLKVDNRKSPIRAQIELDIIQRNGQVARKTKWVKTGDDLWRISGSRGVYEGYIIEEIFCGKGEEYISFTSKPDIIRLNQAVGSVDDEEYKRVQIRKTIQEHLQKELDLRPKGIKVLSLFFIDRVSNYRSYDDEGNPQKGKYARIFEEEYAREISKPKYAPLTGDSLAGLSIPDIHNGYFAIDPKRDAQGNEMLKESRGDGKTQADESAYHLIMRDKERLLSLDTGLKFIFSHSALKEGWDNPNVFQICTLNETASVIKKRQEIGRGMRIAVNQNGERVYGFETNRLTVIANESYEDFAKQLQREIEEEDGVRFGIVERHIFANIPVINDDDTIGRLGVDASKTIWDHLWEKGYINDNGAIQEKLRESLASGTVDLPSGLFEHHAQILKGLRKAAGGLNIKNADRRKKVKLNKAVYGGEDFKNLWDLIKYKTTYRVDFDTEALIKKCSESIKNNLSVGKAKFVTRKGVLDVSRGGISSEAAQETVTVYDARDYELPDIVSYLQNETNLTRRSIIEILKRGGRMEDFKNNPQKFIEQVCAIIKSEMRLFIVDGIKYEKIGEDHYYAQELFQNEELYGYVTRNLLESRRSVYDHVVYDSDIEKEFALAFERNDEIKVYAKLPGWFRIETPLGGYNPDWAVLVEKEGRERLYFIVESKGSILTQDLRPLEKGKIDCGKKHFDSLGNEVDFVVADNYSSFVNRWTNNR